MTQFLTTPVDKSLGTTGSWQDIDLSGDIPVSATGAIFQVANTAAAAYFYGLRKKGSSDDRHGDIYNYNQCFVIIGVDSNRICQGYIENISVDFYLVGYTENDITLSTNGTDKSLGTTGSWQDIDLSSELPSGAIAAIFEVNNTSASSRGYGLRKKGSSDNRHPDISLYNHCFFVIGVDSNRKCQGYIETTDVDLYLIGYLTAGQAETTGIDRSLGSTGSYVDITESGAPSGATGAFGEVIATSGTPSYAVRKNGTSYDYYRDVRNHFGFFTGLDANKKWEGKIENTDVDFYTLGYFSAQTYTKTFTADVLIEAENIKTFTVDVLIEAEKTKTFTADAIIVNRNTKTFTADAIIFGHNTKTFTADVLIEAEKTKTFTADTIIVNRNTKTFTVDAIIFSHNTKTFTADVLIEAEKTKTFTADVLIEAQQTKTFTADIFIVNQETKTFTADVNIVEYAQERGFYYAKLGTENFIGPPDTDFNVTTEHNGIASFDFVIQNNAANRTIIADHLTEDFKIMRDDGTEILTGSIDSDRIEYFAEGEGGAGKRIRLSGYASFIDLAYLIYKRMADADAEAVGSVQDEDNSTATFTDYTTAANNDTINDVLPSFGAANDALYAGKDETFFAAKIKYSTKGIQAANTTVVIEYSKGSDVWDTLDCIDESYAFTEDAGTYLLYTGNKPDDWAKDTINGKNQYHIRFRITEGSYTTPPKLDRIWLSNADVCRVQFNEVSAKIILEYVLEGTGYSEDATDQCPTDAITIRGELDTKLRWIFGIGSALTWEDANGDKQRYDVWIDTSKKTHFKQQRGTDKGDLSGDFRAVNNKMGYHGIGTRIFGKGLGDGINQKTAIVEDTAAQAEHKLREIVLEDSKITGYEALKAETQKSLTIRKAPLKEVSGDIDTKYWLDNSLSVGDKITINQPDWNLNSQELYIMRAVIDPSNTHLDLGTSQMHLEHMRSSLQRQMDISNVWMHGAVNFYLVGPEIDNYQRVDASTVYPVKIKIPIPSDVRAINKVEISWTLSSYKSSVKPSSSSGGGHNHSHGASGGGGGHNHSIGGSGSGGGHYHTGSSDYDGGHIHAIGDYDYGTKTAAATDTNFLQFFPIQSYYSTNVRVYGGGCAEPYDCLATKQITAVSGTYNVTTLAHYHYVTIGTHDHSESTEPDHYHAISTVTEPNHSHTVPDSSSEPSHDHTVPDSSSEPSHQHITDYGIHEEAGGTTLELYVNDVLVANNYVGDQASINITGWITPGNNVVKLEPIVGDNVKGRAEISASVQIFIESK